MTRDSWYLDIKNVQLRALKWHQNKRCALLTQWDKAIYFRSLQMWTYCTSFLIFLKTQYLTHPRFAQILPQLAMANTAIWACILARDPETQAFISSLSLSLSPSLPTPSLPWPTQLLRPASWPSIQRPKPSCTALTSVMWYAVFDHRKIVYFEKPFAWNIEMHYLKNSRSCKCMSMLDSKTMTISPSIRFIYIFSNVLSHSLLQL